MIKALYETHLQVTNLDEAIKYYELLGLECLSRSGSRVAFMMIGPKGQHQEIGLWQIREGKKISKRHFAFEVELEDLLMLKNG
jgi:lactoylglutathione lyase